MVGRLSLDGHPVLEYLSSLAEPVHAEVAIVDVDSKTAAILRRKAQQPGEYSRPMPIRLSCTGQRYR